MLHSQISETSHSEEFIVTGCVLLASLVPSLPERAESENHVRRCVRTDGTANASVRLRPPECAQVRKTHTERSGFD